MDLSRLDDIFRPSAFAEPASMDHAAMYADAVVRLLAHGGPERVTMGAVARAIDQVPSAVKQRTGGRERFLRMVLLRFSSRWLRWVCEPQLGADPLIRIPQGDDEIHGLRVWASLCEIAAGEARAGRPQLAEIIELRRAEHRDFLRAKLRERLGRPPTDQERTLVEQLGIGLCAAVVAPVEPLDPVVAGRLADWVIDQFPRSD